MTDPAHVWKKMTPTGASVTCAMSKFWDHRNNFRTNRAIRITFGTHIEDGASLRKDHKMTLKWAWLGSLGVIS